MLVPCQIGTMLARVYPSRHSRMVVNGTRGLGLKNDGLTSFRFYNVCVLDTATTRCVHFVLRHGLIQENQGKN